MNNNNTKKIRSKFDDMKESFIRLKEEGINHQDISKVLNISRSTASEWSKKLGYVSVATNRHDLHCNECGLSFKGARSNIKYCSQVCRSRYNNANKGNVRQCRYCGDDYKNYRPKVNCTIECRDEEAKRNELLGRVVMALDTTRQKSCEVCNITFYAHRKNQTKCKEHIGLKATTEAIEYVKQCRECDVEYIDDKPTGLYCSVSCSKRWSNRVRDINRRKRIRDNGNIHWDISIDRLIEIQGDECYLCNGEVDRQDYTVSGDGHHTVGNSHPSIDHVIPISKGGTHTWDNVRLTHMICNTIKSNRIEEGQLTLM